MFVNVGLICGSWKDVFGPAGFVGGPPSFLALFIISDVLSAFILVALDVDGCIRGVITLNVEGKSRVGGFS